MKQDLLKLLDIDVPIIQAPMAGISTSRLAAAVSNAGALGSIAVGAGTARQAQAAIAELRQQTARPFNVNVFTHRPAQADPGREAAWLAWLGAHFREQESEAPAALREIYTSFLVDEEMLEVLVAARPAVVSFHFGLPTAGQIEALHGAGIVLMATATSVQEAGAIASAGIDVVVAQGIEAGGHRGVFDPDQPDPGLGTFALVQLLRDAVRIPVIAAGGIMDGYAIDAALRLGASAAQLGTAFILAPESSATAHHRALIQQGGAQRTEMSSVISGRPARGLVNRFFTGIGAAGHPAVPDYPIAYDAAKALHAAASRHGNNDYSVNWAGQGFALARAMPAADMVRTLAAELEQARLRPAPLIT
jgi:nitronate monooxygenase